MRLEEELLRCPLLTSMDEAAGRIVDVGMKTGAEPGRPAQGHLKIMSMFLNNGNAPDADAFVTSRA